jgi:plasmid maintenance system antidote protein VapI
MFINNFIKAGILLIFDCGIFQYMTNIITKGKISIPKTEYYRLKKLDERFKDFWLYLENLIDIREARKEINQKKTISQEKLFKKLGF